MKGAATWIGFTLAAASAVWGGEPPASPGKNPPKVGGEVEISNVPFDLNEVIRTVRKNRGLPEEPPKQGFHAEARGERPFASKGRVFSHETPRFQAEVGENGLRYFAQGNKEKPDFEILSVSFKREGVSQTVFGKNSLEEHAPGLLKGKARDGVTPYVRNRGEEGMEIYWMIDEPLGPDASALRVRLAIQAAGEPEVHPEGLVFPAWGEESQVVLSNVTVVDAAGRRERVRPSLATGREVMFEVPREFLGSARYPILIDPTVGPEILVDSSPVITSTGGDYPSAASSGTNYFVVWYDYRNRVDSDIFGARVASDGMVLDPTGIAVSTAAGYQRYPSVASNGTDYFVAWQDDRNGTDYDIYGARVRASDGLLLDGPPDTGGIAVSTAADDQSSPSAASNGTDYFVAWHDRRNGFPPDIYGARVTLAGTVLDPAGIVISSTGVDGWTYPSVASNGTDYFVVWNYPFIYGARVASDGTVLDPGGIIVSTVLMSQYSSAASNGTDYFVVWDDDVSGTGDFDIYGARVASDGTVLDPARIAVSTVACDQEQPSVASNGTDYFVVWSDWRGDCLFGSATIYGARVRASDGLLLDGPPDTGGIWISGGPDDYYPSVASNGTDYFVAWDSDDNISGARVTSAGTVLDGPLGGGIAVSKAANWQQNPSAASNGTDYFIAWEDRLSGWNWDIYGARVASDGTVLDPAGIAVSTGGQNQQDPSVDSNGTDYFVVWESSYDIYGARVASDGTVLDPAGIAVSTASGVKERPSVASNGTAYFVAWRRSTDIYGARVTSAGTVLDPAGIAVSTAASNQYDPSTASNGTDYFVAWEDFRNDGGCWCNIDIYGARVVSDGTVLDPAGIAVSTAASNQSSPSVASNGTDYFVAWQDYRSGMDYDIYGARVRASDGLLLDGPPDTGGIAVSTAADDQSSPSAASNGTDYFVAWEDRRNLATMSVDIYGARVTSAGTVLDASGILIQQSPYGDLAPAVAYSICGKYLVAYNRLYDDPSFQSQRVFARLFYDGLLTCGVSEVSAPSGIAPLLVEDAGGGQVEIWWENHGELLLYNIYEGDLDSLPPYNHLSLVCWTAGTDEGEGYLSGIITPSYTNAYYLVTECDTATEGTSGYDSDAVERNPLLNTCGPHP